MSTVKIVQRVPRAPEKIVEVIPVAKRLFIPEVQSVESRALDVRKAVNKKILDDIKIAEDIARRYPEKKRIGVLPKRILATEVFDFDGPDTDSNKVYNAPVVGNDVLQRAIRTRNKANTEAIADTKQRLKNLSVDEIKQSEEQSAPFYGIIQRALYAAFEDSTLASNLYNILIRKYSQGELIAFARYPSKIQEFVVRVWNETFTPYDPNPSLTDAENAYMDNANVVEVLNRIAARFIELLPGSFVSAVYNAPLGTTVQPSKTITPAKLGSSYAQDREDDFEEPQPPSGTPPEPPKEEDEKKSEGEDEGEDEGEVGEEKSVPPPDWSPSNAFSVRGTTIPRIRFDYDTRATRDYNSLFDYASQLARRESLTIQRAKRLNSLAGAIQQIHQGSGKITKSTLSPLTEEKLKVLEVYMSARTDPSKEKFYSNFFFQPLRNLKGQGKGDFIRELLDDLLNGTDVGDSDKQVFSDALSTVDTRGFGIQKVAPGRKTRLTKKEIQALRRAGNDSI